MPKQMAADALAYIQQLENQIGELTEKVEQIKAEQQKEDERKRAVSLK